MRFIGFEALLSETQRALGRPPLRFVPVDYQAPHMSFMEVGGALLMVALSAGLVKTKNKKTKNKNNFEPRDTTSATIQIIGSFIFLSIASRCTSNCTAAASRVVLWIVRVAVRRDASLSFGPACPASP